MKIVILPIFMVHTTIFLFGLVSKHRLTNHYLVSRNHSIPLFYAAHIIEYKNVKPDPSTVDPIIEILKIGSMSIFIKNDKPDL